MKIVLYLTVLLIFISCATRKETENCENQFIQNNNVEIKVINDFFYKEHISLSDTLDFHNSSSGAQFRFEGPYLLKNIDEDIVSNYKKGVYLNNYSLRKNYNAINIDKNDEIFQLIDKIDEIKFLNIVSKLNIKKKKKYKPIALMYKKCYVNLTYMYIGTGCVYVPIYKKGKLFFDKIKVPIYLIIELEDISDYKM
jgi:hypothetical protein